MGAVNTQAAVLFPSGAAAPQSPNALNWTGKGALAVADQGLIAASNFLVSLMLARQVVEKQYGAYAVAFEIFLLMVVFYSSFVLEPMSVFGPSVYKNCIREYVGAILRFHIWIALGTLVVLGGAAWMVHVIVRNSTLAMAIAGVAIAGPCVLLFWIARRAFYLNLTPAPAAIGAGIYSTVLLGGLFICYLRGKLSPMVVFLLMAVAGLVTGCVLLRRLKPALAATDPSTREVIQRHWVYGRWALAGSVATWISGAVLYFSLTSFYGLSVTGQLKALLNLSSPIGQGFAAISLLSLPYASRVQHGNGAAGMKLLASRLTLLYVGGTVAYFAVVVLFSGRILHLLYGSKYLAVAGLIPWVGVATALRIGATSQAIPLRALQSPYLVFVAYAASAVVALAVGIPAAWAFGLRGAIGASVLSSAAAMIAAFVLLRRSLRGPLATPSMEKLA